MKTKQATEHDAHRLMDTVKHHLTISVSTAMAFDGTLSNLNWEAAMKALDQLNAMRNGFMQDGR